MKYLLTSLVIISFFTVSSCRDIEDATIEHITVEEMDSLIKMSKVELIDVRTPEEYASGFIEGAVNINYEDENFEDLIAKLDKSKPVAVYCGRGYRSSKCSRYMKKAGFTKIYDLDGGITQWKFKGKTTIKK